MPGRSLDALTARVAHACRTTSGAVALQRAVAETVRAAVPFDAWCVLTIDPASVLPTGGFHREGLALDYMPRFMAIEAGGEDALALPTLARGAERAVTLSTATGGDPARSAHYQEILVPTGFTREMRVLFSTNAHVWGALILFRSADAPDFSDADAALISGATAGVADAIRREMVLTEIAADEHVEGPGLLLLDPDFDRISTTTAAAHWLDRVDDDVDQRRGLPYCVLNLANQAWSRPGPARSRIRTRAGRWVTMHAERLAGPAEQISIIIEATRPVEIAALVADSYRLTAREREVVGLLARGHSRTEIARMLALSTHTVDDHIKRLFGKVGVRSRAELTAKLFFDQHMPRIQDEVPVGGTGWFLR
ncbi:response regulator transcription factor [Nocardia sp. NPDC052566]|uniref:response regulator transcription factor n=1 Tax=Nocardia sp. NPDC052566 TaxID=3364330 RepID=UPI0037C94185